MLNLKDKSRITWIEAVAATKGTGADKVPNLVYRVARPVPVDEMQLRLSEALDAKFKKYCSALKEGIVKENEPYIIAIDRSGLEYIDPMMPMILKVLFGIGDPVRRFPVPEHGRRQSPEPEHSWSAKHTVEKLNGKEISMPFFEDKIHAGISAVIYSTRGILNSPRTTEEMGEDLVIVHNHHARNPLSEGFPPFGSEYRVVGEYVNNTRERKEWTQPDIFES